MFRRLPTFTSIWTPQNTILNFHCPLALLDSLQSFAKTPLRANLCTIMAFSATTSPPQPHLNLSVELCSSFGWFSWPLLGQLHLLSTNQSPCRTCKLLVRAHQTLPQAQATNMPSTSSLSLILTTTHGRTSGDRVKISSMRCMPITVEPAYIGVSSFPLQRASGITFVSSWFPVCLSISYSLITGDLEGWYWHQETALLETTVVFFDEENGWPGLGLEDVLNDLGLPTETSNDPNQGIQTIYAAHFDYSLSTLLKDDPRHVDVDKQTYPVGATTYRATGGYYKFGINTSIGAIFGFHRFSPRAAAEKRIPPVPKDGLSSLQAFSDVAWLYWARHAATVSQIRYFFNTAITNKETQKAIRRALQSTNQAYGPWPGATFSTSSTEGKVLLGTCRSPDFSRTRKANSSVRLTQLSGIRLLLCAAQAAAWWKYVHFQHPGLPW